MKLKKITILSPTFNEEENILDFYKKLKGITKSIKNYSFDILIIDNCSEDNTVTILEKLAKKDKNLKVIINSRNFGHIRSPFYGMLQIDSDAMIYLASDFQDPPELIIDFINNWESGYDIVLGSKPQSKTSFLMHFFRKIYYKFLNSLSDFNIVKNATGFGIYDKKVLDQIKTIYEPYPYFRGLISDFGYKIKCIDFIQPKRKGGTSKNNFYTLYDIGILGIISHSIIPLRLMSFFGFALGLISLIVGFIYLILKIIYWNSFPLGFTPLLIGLFFLFGALFLSLGLVGEYIASIHRYVQKRPIVVERRRINF
jgi:glycosyltransferase involved in cell wall biosynthesis